MKDVIEHIVFAQQYIHDFWQSGGWASGNAAELLRRARLDRQVSLARCLSRWIEEPPTNELEGHLILAWANLGSLLEGTMTWFLCVWEHSYASIPRLTRAGDTLAPDRLWFEELIRYYSDNVWVRTERTRWQPWCDRIRQHRNAIHAYRHRPLGTFADLEADIRTYREFLNDLNLKVPYPDEHPKIDLQFAALPHLPRIP